MAAFGGPVGPLGVGDLAQVPHEPAQLRRVQPTGRLDQHRVGVQPHMLGKLVGAFGDHRGMGR